MSDLSKSPFSLRKSSVDWPVGFEVRSSVNERILRTIDEYPSSFGSHQCRISGSPHDAANLSLKVGGYVYLSGGVSIVLQWFPQSIFMYPLHSIVANFLRNHNV